MSLQMQQLCIPLLQNSVGFGHIGMNSRAVLTRPQSRDNLGDNCAQIVMWGGKSSVLWLEFSFYSHA